MAFRRRVVVVAERAAIQETIVACVRPLGVPVITATNLDELLRHAQGPIGGVVVVAWPTDVAGTGGGTGGGDVGALRALGGRLAPRAEVIPILIERSQERADPSSPPPHSSARLAACVEQLRIRGCNHVILHPAPCPDRLDELGRGSPLGLTATLRKLMDGDYFGIEKYLTAPAETDPAHPPIHCVQLRDYAGRLRAIEALTEFVVQLGLRRALRSAIVQATEELLMNALYDAPVDPAGAPLFGEVDSRDRLAQPSPKPVSFRYTASSSHIVIAVRDHFGGLRKATVLTYLGKQIESPRPLDQRPSGAGLGLYFVANVASDYVINLAPGLATEVICTFERTWTPPPLRSLSLFNSDPEQGSDG